MRRRIDQAREGYLLPLLWEQITRMYGEKEMPLFMRSDGWGPEEKRLHPRLPCFWLVDYAVQGFVYRDFIKDISVGGTFIESRKLPTGPEITMVFSFLDDHNPIKMTGRVAWIGEQGIGVKFAPDLLRRNKSG